MGIRSSRFGALALAFSGVLLISACGGTTTDSQTPINATSPTGDALQQAKDSTAQAMKGTNRPVDPTSRPAAKGKKIAVISAGQASISSQIPADGAVEAAKTLGWSADIYDGQLNPSTYPGLVRQAIAANVDGIILVAIDCNAAKEPLQEAKAKGIKVVPLYAFDCNDAKGGGGTEPLFSGITNYGPDNANIDEFTKSYGADQANYIIADSENQAKIIAINDSEFVVLNWTYEGFKETIDASGGSQIVSTLEITTADLTNGQLVPKIQAEMLRHPEATWIKSPFTYATILGVAPALGAQAGKIKVMGSEGFAPELDLIRQGSVTAANVISSDWSGWAAADTLNSVFIGVAPVDSGIGWTILDKDHNLPASGEFVPPVDYKAAYKKAWGVS